MTALPIPEVPRRWRLEPVDTAAEDRARDEAAVAGHELSGGYWRDVMAKGREVSRPLVFEGRPGVDGRLFGRGDDPDLHRDTPVEVPAGGWPG